MQKRLAECRVAIVGLGLMGASLALDLTQDGIVREVRGIARRTATVLEAFFAGAVDLATNDLETGVLGADIVILATPVRTIVQILEEIGPVLWPGTIVMDMGSTKDSICQAMDKLPPGVQPIGGHPMTGKETAGFAAAERGLYRGAPWILSPLQRTSPSALQVATELVVSVGARPYQLPPPRHDRVVAAISHLPYMVAGALVHAVAATAEDDALVWQLAAGGFRDTSRVAASDTRMFLDILLTNRAAILEQLDSFGQHLDELRILLRNEDEESLRTKLQESQDRRARWRQTQ